MDATTYRIEILTNDLGIVHVPGYPDEFLQVARVMVTGDGELRSHVVVLAATPRGLMAAGGTDLHKLFPRDIISLVLEQTHDTTTIRCEASAEPERFGAAASVAALKRAWGWDESSRVHVNFQDDGLEFTVNPVWDGDAWTLDL